MNTDHFRAWAVMGAALAAGILVLMTLVEPVEAAFPGANGKIVFTSTRTTGVDNPTGDYEIFTMNPDGSGLTQLTNNTAFDTSPSFSADGNAVVFSSDRDGNFEIYIMDADGTKQKKRTNNSGDIDDDPDWQTVP